MDNRDSWEDLQRDIDEFKKEVGNINEKDTFEEQCNKIEMLNNLIKRYVKLGNINHEQ